MAAATRVGKAALLLGKCVPSVKPNASKICVTQMELDTNLLMYFKKSTFFFVHDPERKCKTGDVVLIEQLAQKLSRDVTHRLVDIVSPMGDVVDPLTGKKVVSFDFRDDIVQQNKLIGDCDNAFEYEKAPPRGRFEGTRDFTDKETYKKYHEIPGTPQPYGI